MTVGTPRIKPSTHSRWLRLGARYLRHRFKDIHPLDVEAALLNDCNLRCAYCRYPETPKPQLSTAQWKAIIREFAALGALRFKLHGGEPTLRPDFRELASEVRSSGMLASAVTNGTVIPRRPEIIDDLDELVVSLDSPHRNVNDGLRGAGSHEGALRTIDISLRKGILTVVNMVVTKPNFGDIKDMLDFCESRGLLLNIQPITFKGLYYVTADHKRELSNRDIRGLHLLLIAWKRRGRSILFSTEAYRRTLDWPDYLVTARKGERSSCIAGRGYIRLECNGDVVPCCQYHADFEPMNILRHGLRESLRHVKTHNCEACWLPYYNERAALFKLHPGAVWSFLRRTWNGRPHKP